MQPTATPSTTRPTRTRYRVVGFILLLAAITYLDRNAVSILTPDIRKALNLSTVQMSWVFSVFAIAYALFEIPTAWWGGRIGSRKILARIVGWWSTFTIATPFAWSFPSLLGIRFLFGQHRLPLAL